jgi:hypothetical protein
VRPSPTNLGRVVSGCTRRTGSARESSAHNVHTLCGPSPWGARCACAPSQPPQKDKQADGDDKDPTHHAESREQVILKSRGRAFVSFITRTDNVLDPPDACVRKEHRRNQLTVAQRLSAEGSQRLIHSRASDSASARTIRASHSVHIGLCRESGSLFIV